MDGKREAGLPGTLKASLAGAAVVGLLALVALGARGSHPGAHYQAHQREVPAQVGNDLLTVILIAYGLGLLVLLAVFLMLRHKWIEPRSRWLRDLFVTLAVCCFVTLVAFRLAHDHNAFRFFRRLHQQAGTTAVHNPPGGQTLPQRPGPTQPAHFDWKAAALLGALGLLTAAFFLARTRQLRTAEAEPAVGEELGLAVGESIEDLRREADPRRAVIAAYARMEGVLRRHGRARRAAEAPYEYLERVLRELQVRPSAVAELTELFERAKFSVHRIDGGMKTRAIDALVSVREDLARG